MPENRLWHVNVITNYDFKNGKLKGWKVGGAARYQSARPTHAPWRICIWTDPHPSVEFPPTGLCAVPHSAVPGSACTCYMGFGRRTGVVQ